jgi:hypothetical protein
MPTAAPAPVPLNPLHVPPQYPEAVAATASIDAEHLRRLDPLWHCQIQILWTCQLVQMVLLLIDI